MKWNKNANNMHLIKENIYIYLIIIIMKCWYRYFYLIVRKLRLIGNKKHISSQPAVLKAAIITKKKKKLEDFNLR